MLPTLTILDPELTVGMPAFLTAATGMDAFAHNLEAYCAPGYHPMADGIALEGMSLIKKWLAVAVNEGENLEARGHMITKMISFQKIRLIMWLYLQDIFLFHLFQNIQE